MPCGPTTRYVPYLYIRGVYTENFGASDNAGDAASPTWYFWHSRRVALPLANFQRMELMHITHTPKVALFPYYSSSTQCSVCD